MAKGDQIKITNKKIKSNSSKKWLRRQLADPFVEKAKMAGFRSRAIFKLEDMQEKFKLIGKNSSVLDLGCAPGSWLQLVVELTKEKVMGVDLLEIPPISPAKIIKGDIVSDEVVIQIKDFFPSGVDVLLSDMAANTTGQKSTDHLRTINLCEKALFVADELLKENGNMVMKFFDGALAAKFLQEVKNRFSFVRIYKPKASRAESSESYIVAIGRKPKPL
ncbi:MAG: RlmE family RNA methyltransferase [Alphaproteobacteria bacterium]